MRFHTRIRSFWGHLELVSVTFSLGCSYYSDPEIRRLLARLRPVPVVMALFSYVRRRSNGRENNGYR